MLIEQEFIIVGCYCDKNIFILLNVGFT